MRRPKSKDELDRDIEEALASTESVGYWPSIPSMTREVRAWTGSAARERHASASAPKARKVKPSSLFVVLDAVRAAPVTARYGRADVFIYPLWKKVKGRLGMTLEQFKRWLIEENRAQHLALARADMVDDMDPGLVEKSEVSDLGAEFHFVIDESARRRHG